MDKSLFFAASAAVLFACAPAIAVAADADDFRTIAVVEDSPERDFSVKVFAIDVEDEEALADGIVTVGDKIGFELEGVENSSVYIFNMSSDGEVAMIFPNGKDSENEPGESSSISVPPDGANYSFQIEEPAGIELVKIMVVRGDYSALEDLLYEGYFDRSEFPRAIRPVADIASFISDFSVEHGETQFVEATLELEVVE